ncbi:MAG: hypothetical protein ACRDY7_14745, partial [Acidimicrobiia bacterium]
MAVSAVAVAGYSRLFADAGWMVPAALAVAGAHLVGAATGAWRWTRAVAAHALALAVLLAGTVGGSTVAGLPTVATVERLGTAVSDAGGAFRSAIVPAPTTPELILWVVAGTWVCAAISQRLARRRPASLGAAVPLVVIQVLVAVLGT